MGLTDQAKAIAADQPLVEQPAGNVIAALSRVMRDLPGIGRDSKSDQGYQYRGIEAITREAQGLLARHGVVFVPKVLSREVVDLTINNRPWTEQQAWILYTVYGPGGVEDRIEVGPFVAQGRDNSDKGMNKCMTQAFKYALLQTLCIGDAKDDADGSKAHEADARGATIDPDAAARHEVSTRIRQMDAEGRQGIRNFCDERSIPRVPAQWTDEQMEQVVEALDFLELQPPADDGAGGEVA